MDNTPPRRILIGANSFADARAAIRMAARLARETSAALGGVLVQEQAVLAACALPNRRLVSPGGALGLAPSLARLRRMLDADAQSFRQLLHDVAGPVAASWTFERQAGELVASLSQSATRSDILVFGHRYVHPVAGRVLLLRRQGGASPDADRLARALAEHLGTGLSVRSVGTAPEPGAEATYPTEQAAIAAIDRCNCSAVLIDLAADPAQSMSLLRRLLDVARCPVIVLRAPQDDM
ncbi:hypothetical protein QO034_10260 [Sedimentitalea sp. JM2-8]|uniref:Universal stress protein family protein n=1 Tax=Sedimentitalea xiamensis TaxID=3050037 RepID=A0ABT7FEE4_9RHOB|nr:hypothetical protein [Sedimentitalea xiamensis]MDK3073494.1 hypothetical protein [Sedimentitalea xiamensis]